MPGKQFHQFDAPLQLIGVNPYVAVPPVILETIFQQAGKTKGHIPVKGTVNGKPYTQTLVRYAGACRLYINTSMLKESPGRIGERITVSIMHDTSDRSIAMPAPLEAALRQNKTARLTFEKLPPSRQKEIVRYIASLKTEASVARNVERAIGFLNGTGRFVGRDKP